MADKCKSCKYYKKIDDSKGRCRRFPPTSLIGSIGAVREPETRDYSIVEKTDWCGEFIIEET